MELNGLGKIAERFWKEIPSHFDFVKLDEFVIMPNHVHGILIFDKSEDRDVDIRKARQCLVTTETISMSLKKGKLYDQNKETVSSVIGSYKSVCTKHIRKYKQDFAWQYNFYDRIIRDEKELDRIRKYIYENPMNWGKDKYFLT